MGWAWANRSGGEWVALAAVLVTTVLALYGRAICRDSPHGTIAVRETIAALVRAEKEEEPAAPVNGQKVKEGNGTHAVVDAAQAPAPGTSVDNVSEAPVESISGEIVENVPELSVERVSTGKVGERGEVNDGLTARGIADGVVIRDLSSVETNGLKLSCQEEVTVENSLGRQVWTDKAAVGDEDTPTGEVMTSDVSSEEVRDGELGGGSSHGLSEVAQGKEASGKLYLDRMAPEKPCRPTR